MALAPLSEDEVRVLAFSLKAGPNVVREFLASLAGVEPSLLVFGRGEFGKPFLVHPRTDLHFNVAHSQDDAVVAVTRSTDVGVDIERMRDVAHADAIAARFFSEEEQRVWRRSAGKRKDFLRLWTRHEACVKAMGTGLFKAPKKGRIGWFHSLDLGPELFGAVAGDGKPRRLVQINVSRVNSGRVSGWSML